MSNISEWSTTAASNNSASPNGAPEGMAPSGVNDTMREMMAAVARWFGDAQGSLVTSGTGAAYTLTTNNSNSSLSDISLLIFRVHAANTGTSATLAVDGLTAKSLRAHGTSTLEAGILATGELVVVAYNSTNDAFDILGKFNLNPQNATNLTSGTLPAARLPSTVWTSANDGSGSGLDADTLDGSEGSAYAKLASANTFTASNPTLVLSAAIPMLRWNETDATADNKRWIMFADGETFAFATNDDADTTNGNILLVSRTGTTVDTVNFANGELQYGGIEVGFRGIPDGTDEATAAGQNGKVLYLTAGTTLNTARTAGDTFAIYNDSASAITITQGTGLTMRLLGTTTTGNRTIAARGWMTVHVKSSTEYLCSGPGVS